ncbi:C2H2 type zinc-finger-domain-containing protein [Phaeosphaeria sp. MPI-PUGE-AT-0046c]|nr:C2H2 type zinc-finger-domain-containing protein [Phaeosphaeria sp. MPI-PUGE-AT-0046c]
MESKTRTYPCNTCSKTYNNSAEQREHMHGEWHISNLRRKVAGEPAESEEKYYHGRSVPARKSPAPVARPDPSFSTPKKRSPSPTNVPVVRPTNCLFCTHTASTIEKNLAHMSATHGMYIPSAHRITDIDSFLTYLATIVHEWHECLYCGVEKGSTQSVQTHMRDKGHCKIDEEEVDDFLEQEDEAESDEGKRLSETEWRLPSGAIINPRSDNTSSARAALLRTRRTVERGKKKEEVEHLTITDASEASTPTPSSSHSAGALAVRNAERSLAGVSEHQVRALVATEKKMKTQAALAEARSRQRLVREPVLTKYYKTENPVYQAG